MARKRWKYSIGERPNTVTVYERNDLPGGPFYVRIWDRTLRGGRGNYLRRSLGHRDCKRARAYAREQCTKLERGVDDIKCGRITLARLFRLYEQYRTSRKSASSQVDDRRRIKMWLRVLGPKKDPHKITLAEWEGFSDARGSGGIDAFGRTRPEGERKRVRTRTVEADLKWLRLALNWATRWQERSGAYLLRENCVRGYEIATEKNPLRPIASQDRFESLRAVSDLVEMRVNWHGRQQTIRSHLSELLDIAYGTGRRLSPMCKLTYGDLRLDRGPHGSIRWPASTDKSGRETTVPISPQVRAALDRVLRDRPGIGDAPLFPSPFDPTKPITRNTADRWLRKAEVLAGLESQVGSSWHAFRRGWVTARKHMPDVDVAEAGGWKSLEVLRAAYQQSDEATMLDVVLGGGELRERKA
jgi:integrase